MKRMFRNATVALFFAAIAIVAFGQDEFDVVGPAAMGTAKLLHDTPAPLSDDGQAHARFGIANIDSIPNFNDHYFADGFDASGNLQREWFTNTVGNPPQMHGTTTIDAPVIPVSVDLRNFDGTPRYYQGKRLFFDATQYVQPVLESPVFSNNIYSSSPVPTQFTDAIQRAQFYRRAKDDWHTTLNGVSKTPRTIVLIRGTYSVMLYPDGRCCRAVLVNSKTFYQAFRNVVTDAIKAGDITTKDISTFLFPDTYMNGPYCCTAGFHTYFYSSNQDPEPRWVVNFSTWASNDPFEFGIADIEVLNHEMAEIYNDPFVASDGLHNVTPWWAAGAECQRYLEVADATQLLPNAVYPMTMPNGYTYHPQSIALRPWFEFESPSSAIDGSYSYPDETVLPALSPIERPGCQ